MRSTGFPDQRTSSPVHRTSLPDQRMSLPDQRMSLPDQSTSLPDQSTSLPEHRTLLPDHRTSRPDITPCLNPVSDTHSSCFHPRFPSTNSLCIFFFTSRTFLGKYGDSKFFVFIIELSPHQIITLLQCFFVVKLY